ncbi:MAG: hypothetical protein RL120_00130 [Gammaproteobacteria bacterium]
MPISRRRLLARSLFAGFLLGISLAMMAPLGLGIYPIEFLRPVLIPGFMLTQLLLGNEVGLFYLLLGVILNCLVFFMVIFAWSLLRYPRGNSPAGTDNKQ